MKDNSNDNRTKIYRIRRKEDGLFLENMPRNIPGQHVLFGPVGCFWRKPETIRKHLMELISFRMFCGDGWHRTREKISNNRYGKAYPYGRTCYAIDVPHRLVKFVPEWLDKYEVVATDITIHGENTMEAKDFANLNPIDVERVG